MRTHSWFHYFSHSKRVLFTYMPMCTFPLSGCRQVSLATHIASINTEVIKLGLYLPSADVLLPLSWGISSHCEDSLSIQYCVDGDYFLCNRTLWSRLADLRSFACNMLINMCSQLSTHTLFGQGLMC